MFKVPEMYRLKKVPPPLQYLSSSESSGNNGCFKWRGINNKVFFAQASDGSDWEHVSVSIPGQKTPPDWQQMCYVKSIFWEPNDVVIQFHPAKQDYINMAINCLHLWRPTKEKFPTPEKIMVGF